MWKLIWPETPARSDLISIQILTNRLVDWKSANRWSSHLLLRVSNRLTNMYIYYILSSTVIGVELRRLGLKFNFCNLKFNFSTWSSTRRSRVELQLGRDVLVLLRVQLQRNVDELGGKYTEAEPRCTCPPHESTLQWSQRWFTECNFSAMLTSWEASTPRRSRGVLVLPTSQHCRGVCGGSLSATPMQVWHVGR